MQASFYSLESVGLGYGVAHLAQLYFNLDNVEQLYFEELDEDSNIEESGE